MDRKRNDIHSVFNIASVSRLISSCLEQNSSKSRSMKNLKTAHSTVNSHLTDALNSGRLRYNGHFSRHQLILLYFMYYEIPE